MQITRLTTIGSSDAMKSGDGNDILYTLISQSTGKDPIITVDKPAQWMQLLHALDQPDLAYWPVITPLKVQVHKCERCSKEFFSPINYRRHMRIHRRSLNFDKDSRKYRDLLGAFWDKLSLEKVKEVASFNDISLKEIPGNLIVDTLTESLQNSSAWIWSLPTLYMKAGSNLLDIIEAKPSILPISSRELFSVLDDASEGTFLCAGTADSVQKYIFDDEAAKACLELRNLVACICFLFEQILVKAWIADKEAEALRCQKLLVEEEEAAQKRQTELLEKKRQKKLRQKELKAKDQISEEKVDLGGTSDSSDNPPVAEICSPPTGPTVVDSYSGTLDVAAEDIASLEKNDEDIKAFDELGTAQNTAPEQKDEMKNEKSFELIFGDLPPIVTVKSCCIHIGCPHLAKTQDHSGKSEPSKPQDQTGNTEPAKTQDHTGNTEPTKVPSENKVSEMENGYDLSLDSITGIPSDHWVHVTRRGKGQKRNSVKVGDQNLSYAVENADGKSHSHQLPECSNTHTEGLSYSSGIAKTFLAKRWNEVVSSDHVKLVISPVPKSQASPSSQNNIKKSAAKKKK